MEEKMSRDDVLRKTSPPLWHLLLRGDHGELHEILEHIQFTEWHVWIGEEWLADDRLLIRLEWIGAEIASLVRWEVEGLWPNVQILQNNEVSTCQD